MAEHSADDIDPGAHRVLADASRVAVLETLRRSRHPMAIPDLAAQVGLHPNTVRAHLALLTEHGHVTGAPEDRTRPGRPRLLYTAVTKPGDDGQRGYRLLAEALISYLGGGDEDRGVAAVAAGRAFGERAIQRGGPSLPGGQPDAAIDRIVDLLAEAGFDPARAGDGTHIELHRCPFRELAVEDPEVVCGVHLGIMQGALHELGAPVEATRLLPFVQPGLCVATLRTHDDAPGGPNAPGGVEAPGGAPDPYGGASTDTAAADTAATATATDTGATTGTGAAVTGGVS